MLVLGSLLLIPRPIGGAPSGALGPLKVSLVPTLSILGLLSGIAAGLRADRGRPTLYSIGLSKYADWPWPRS